MRPGFEAFIQIVIFYSIGSYLFELEWGGGPGRHPFFVWSERVVAAIFTAEYLIRRVRSRAWTDPLRPEAVAARLTILPYYLGSLVDGRW